MNRFLLHRLTAAVGTPNSAPVASSVSIAGTPSVGETLTGSHSYSDPEGTAESGTTRQWYRADNGAGTGRAAISGATATTYVVQAADAGKYLQYGVTPRDGELAGDEAVSAYSGPVTQSVVYIGDGENLLRSLAFDGANWATRGTGAARTVTKPSIARLSATRVVVADNTNGVFQAFDWNGTTWVAVGSSLATGTTYVTIVALSSTRIASYGINDILRVYDFNGSAFTKIGTDFAVPGSAGETAMAALSANRVALCNGGSALLGAYDFNGSTWSLVGSTLSGTGGTNPHMTALSSTAIAFYGFTAGAERLHYLTFNGSTWASSGTPLDIGSSVASLTALSATRIALHRNDTDLLYTFDRVANAWSQTGGTISTVSNPFYSALAALGFSVL